MLELCPRRAGPCGRAPAALLLLLSLVAIAPSAQATPVRWELAGVVTESTGFDFAGLPFEGTLIFDPDAAPAATSPEHASWLFAVPPAAFQLRVDGQSFAIASGRSFRASVGDDFVPDAHPGDPEPAPRDALSFVSFEDGVATFPYFNFGLRGADLDLFDELVLPGTPPDLADVEIAQVLYGHSLGGPSGTFSFAGELTSLRAVALPEPRVGLLVAVAAVLAAAGARGR